MNKIKNQNIFWATYTMDLNKPSIITKYVIEKAIKTFWNLSFQLNYF